MGMPCVICQETSRNVASARVSCTGRGSGRSRRTRSRSGRSARSTGLEDVRLVNLARQSSSSLSCGKRILSRPGLIAAAGRRREGGGGVERCRCACQVFFMLCMHHISLRLSLLRCLFLETNLKSLSNRLVTSFLFDPTCCCYMKPFPLIVVWAAIRLWTRDETGMRVPRQQWCVRSDCTLTQKRPPVDTGCSMCNAHETARTT